MTERRALCACMYYKRECVFVSACMHERVILMSLALCVCELQFSLNIDDIVKITTSTHELNQFHFRF